jgi:hypothetical protein
MLSSMPPKLSRRLYLHLLNPFEEEKNPVIS